jgi:paraquat-inducible protein A
MAVFSDMTTEHSSLIACPSCDALYTAHTPGKGDRAVCVRCHTVLIARRKDAGLRIVALAVAALILVVGAISFPFLGIHIGGFRNDASLIDAALAFSDGLYVVLSLAVIALIVFLPALRMLLTIYVLVPLVLDTPPWPGAKRAFRWAEQLRPWSMAEIFVIGCAVALVKLADLATVDLGPAFWMFAVLVVVLVVQETLMCRWSVWRALDK